MWPLGIAVLVSLMAPVQNTSQIPVPYHIGPAPLFQIVPPHPHVQVEQQVAEDQISMCFAIRSYIFKREDSKAPVLVKTLTCTPAAVLQERRVGEHNVRLVPAN
jgi:hypothetical protein